MKINATKTDVGATEAIVGHGEQAFPLEMRDGGNTIGMGRIGSGDEQLLSLCGQVYAQDEGNKEEEELLHSEEALERCITNSYCDGSSDFRPRGGAKYCFALSAYPY